MSTLLEAARAAWPAPARHASNRPRASWTADLVTSLLGAWMVAGLIADGHAHVFTPELETFFTPSHGVLYSGFVGATGWIAWQIVANLRRGRSLAMAIPRGYGLGLLGAAIFAAGGVFDLAWHTVFGIEADIEALISPPHLVLLLGGTLILTIPWRAAWAAPDGGAAPSFPGFLPVLVSATATAMSAAFFLIYLSPFTPDAPTAERAVAFAGPEQQELFQEQGIGAILVSTAVLLVALLLLLRRWRVPLGTATVMFTAVSTSTYAVFGFERGVLLLAGLIGGVATDALLRWLRPSADRPGAVRALGATVPAAVWLPYFALLALRYQLGWSLELWAGAVVLASLAGLALGLLAAPPSVPATGTGERTGDTPIPR